MGRLQCRCGQFRAQLLQPEKALRLVCYCRDCQSFAHFLGNPRGMLDAEGGTDLLAVSPHRLRIDQGAAQLAVMRLSPNGSYRWYVTCCQSPLGSAPANLRLAHISLASVSCQGAGEPGEGNGLGPVRAIAHRGSAHGPVDGPSTMASTLALGRYAAELVWGMLRGIWRRNPLIDARAMRPLAPVTVVTLAQRNTLRALASQPPKSNA